MLKHTIVYYNLLLDARMYSHIVWHGILYYLDQNTLQYKRLHYNAPIVFLEHAVVYYKIPYYIVIFL